MTQKLTGDIHASRSERLRPSGIGCREFACRVERGLERRGASRGCASPTWSHPEAACRDDRRVGLDAPPDREGADRAGAVRQSDRGRHEDPIRSLREPVTGHASAAAKREAPLPSTMDRAGRAMVLGAIILLVVVRFFTEVVSVIPRAANFVDIPIFFTLAIGAAFVRPARNEQSRWYVHFGLLSLLFLIVCVVSVVVNSGRVAPAPVLVFIYGFLAPFGAYAAAHRVWPVGNASALSRLIVGPRNRPTACCRAHRHAAFRFYAESRCH